MSAVSNGHNPVPVEVARWLLRHGIYAVPVRFKAKTVSRDGWIKERWEEADLEAKFGAAPTNVGILLGDASNRLADCDLDTPEAIAAAPFFLPATGMVWGRAGKPASHRAYFIDAPLDGRKNIQYKDPTIKKSSNDVGERGMLCELRLKGQTIGPGSIHPSGEPIVAEGEELGEPSIIAYEALLAAMGKVAACSLLTRYWMEGIRHDAALPLAGMLCRGGMPKDDALRFVDAVCRVAGEAEDDIANRLGAVSDTYARAERGDHYTAGQTLEDFFDPKIVGRLRDWLALSRNAYSGDIGPDGLPLSDIGNAERFATKWNGSALYSDDEDAWYLYTGKRWERDRSNAVYRRAMEVVNAFRALIANPSILSRGNTTPDQWRRHADKMGNARQVRSMLDLATAFLPVLPEEFDSDPYLFNVPNGTLELKDSGEHYLREHRPDDLLTMLAAAEYVPGATHPLVEEALDRFFPEPARREFFQRHAGYVLTGQPKRYALQLIGPTNAGKSMMLDLMGRTLGDYAGTLKYDSIMRKHNSGGDTPRADLWGVKTKRLVTIAEIPDDAVYDVALFKTLLSGGDKQLIRTLYDRTGGRSVAMTFALWTSGNAPYGPPGDEAAAYERLHVLWCEHQVPRHERSELKQAATLNVAETGSAVLAWMLEGYAKLYGSDAGRLLPPDFVVKATQEIQDSRDPWTQFFEDTKLIQITGSPVDGILKAELWACARSWREITYGRMTAVRKDQWAFEAAMERRVGPTKQSSARWNNRDYWPGVHITDDGLRSGLTPPDWNAEASAETGTETAPETG